MPTPPFRSDRNSVHFRSDGTYKVDIVGEARYQDEILKIVGRKTRDAAEHLCMAELWLEDDNPHDPNAVLVAIESRVVGYLSRPYAVAWRKLLRERNLLGCRATAPAKIVGGWKRKGDEGHFGVKLDI